MDTTDTTKYYKKVGKMEKQLWMGAFMFNRECHIRYTYAFSAIQARMVMIRRMAKEQEINPRVIFGYFKDHPDRAIITIEKKEGGH
jgi:hypothetical protein